MYKEIKNQTISDMNISYNNLMEIKVKTMNTLKMLMGGLLLMPEFEIIYSGQKQKLQQIKEEPEDIKKGEMLD